MKCDKKYCKIDYILSEYWDFVSYVVHLPKKQKKYVRYSLGTWSTILFNLQFDIEKIKNPVARDLYWRRRDYCLLHCLDLLELYDLIDDIALELLLI